MLVILQTECNRTYIPGEDNEHVESVPRLSEVRLLADHSHRGHLHQHFHGKEDEYEVVEDLENLAADGDAHLVRTWLVQSERQTVEKYHTHAHPFKPRSDSDQGSTVVEVSTV